MQIIYAFKGNESDDLGAQQRFLLKSMNSMYDLYLLSLALLMEVQVKAKDHLEKKQKKHLATSEDKNPNRKFINNEVLMQLSQNKALQQELADRRINNWSLDDEYVEIVYKSMLESDIYKEYMSTELSTYKEDKAFVIDLFKNIVAPNDKIYEYIEDKNITWIDDLPAVNTTIVKLFRKIKPTVNEAFFTPNLFKDTDDRDYAIDLLKKTILNLSNFSNEISSKTANWDKDRIANTDFVLLQMAICEFNKFPSIPVKVTINEYLEIAKEYSTPKSSVFINGILDKLIKEYETKGTLNKIGRGLM
ncbi:MAG: transcription antitermination factor NusB [Flavobacteriaceae bacterium]|nr:transcription antitermination factor NusB [Flavobacteriaceae bacterium]